VDHTEFRAALDELGVSQRRFARQINMDITSVSRWATNKAEIPGIAAAYIRLLLAHHRATVARQK
jgi:DNA-binding transcriptional regulator YiaG